MSNNIDSHSKFLMFMEVLQDIIIEDEFSYIRNSFFEENYMKFDEYSEENKHEYYNIFQLYIQTVEGYLNKKLKEKLGDLNIENSIKEMTNYKNEVDEELLEMFISFSDFYIFKEMIIDYKKSKSNGLFDKFDMNIIKLDGNMMLNESNQCVNSNEVDEIILKQKETSEESRLNKKFISGKDIFNIK